jgi:2-polyprenyl-3-methyl-5-hydroxy-6-metoxy-1,4-benzoquinol methylase
MMALALRSREEEEMDSAELDPGEYDKVLRDLSRVNRWTFAARPTLDFIERAAGSQTKLSLLDVGFGSGDMLRAIWCMAKKRGISAQLVGVDINPKSAPVAQAMTPPDAAMEFRTGDYRAIQGRFDIIVSNLVAHHMNDAELLDFIQFMEERAEKGWIINDLHRHAFAYSGYPLLARLLGVHRIVREDGRLSIARSFRFSDWQKILARAGICKARIVRRFPFRLCVERLR